MKKIIKHYPMTDRLIVRGGYYRVRVMVFNATFSNISNIELIH